jgi:acyl-CoA thioester hydrolase
MHAIDLGRAASRLALRVRFCETDLMGIVHHANYLAYLEAGRVDWLRKRGVTYADWAAQGRHLPVVDCTLRYRAPARFDDVIEIETRLSELRAVSLRYDYSITRAGVLLVEGSTRLASVDHAHRLHRFTDEMLDVLTSSERAVTSNP